MNSELHNRLKAQIESLEQDRRRYLAEITELKARLNEKAVADDLCAELPNLALFKHQAGETR